MNFVKSKSNQDFSSTDNTQGNRQGFGRVGGYNGPGPIMNNAFGYGNSMGPRGGGFGRPRFGGGGGGGFGLGYSGSANQQFGGSSSFGGVKREGKWESPSRQRFEGGGGGGEKSSDYDERKPLVASAKYSGFVKPQKTEDQFEGGDGKTPPPSAPPPSSSSSSSSSSHQHVGGGMPRSYSTPSMRHPYSGPRFPGSPGRGFGANSSGIRREGGGGPGPIRAGHRGMSRGSRGFAGSYGRGGGSTSNNDTSNDNFASIEAATAAAARATREAKNPNAKCVVLPQGNGHLIKFRRLACEIKKLKTKRPNAVDAIHSAANIAHVSIQSEMESGPIVRGTGTFFCLVQFDGVNIAVSSGLNKRSAKSEAFELALEKLNKPYHRIIEIDGNQRELQSADYDFSAERPKQTVIKPMSAVVSNISGDGEGLNSFQKESNVEAIVDIKKRNYVAKEIGDFVLVEPQDHNSSVNGASILRRSADFSKMLLEYDFASHGSSGAVRCMLKVEGKTLADVVAHSKPTAKVEASQKAVDVLRSQCWTILTKQVHDSNAPEISKDELFDDLATCFAGSSAPSGGANMNTPIADTNKGKQLLAKMGWRGGGIGKDGAGIEEPVTMKQVINREGLGLDAKRGISVDFRQRIVEILENYTASSRQDDLVFSPHFRKDERVIIHNECRRLGLKSKSNSQGGSRYLIVRRKRSAFQLLEHVMRCGGETARYKVVPPGERKYPWKSSLPLPPSCTNSGGNLNNSAKNQACKPGSLSSSASAPVLSSMGQGGKFDSRQVAAPMISKVLAQVQADQIAEAQDQAMMQQHDQQGMMGGNNPGFRFGQQNGPRFMMGQNQGMMGQYQQQGMMGHSQWMMGQNQGMMGQNMMGQNQQGMMGQFQQGMMGQNQQGMMGQSQQGMMGQNQQGMMGQNQQGMKREDVKGEKSMMGQNQQQGMMGQNQQQGMMGQNQQQGMIGQNQQGMMGQNMGQGMMGFMGMPRPVGPLLGAGPNSGGLLGNRPPNFQK